jgi:hypothetical protein
VGVRHLVQGQRRPVHQRAQPLLDRLIEQRAAVGAVGIALFASVQEALHVIVGKQATRIDFS